MNIFNSMSQPLRCFMAGLMFAVLVGCGGNNVTAPASSSHAITNYSFVGYPGAPVTINQTGLVKSIALTLPFGTDVSALVATYVSTGASVAVGAALQTSGITPNNFVSPVTYTVTAADGQTASYMVSVTVASSSAKALSSFSFVGFSGLPGVITEPAHSIAVTLPFGTPVTALTSSFATTGVAVMVGGVTQVSNTVPSNDFTLPVAYSVHAADGSTAIYTVTVSLAAANPTPPVLGEAGRFVILAPAAITTTGVTAISNGDMGISPAARSLMTGFTPVGATGGVTELLNGTTYAADDANPAPFPLPLHFYTPVIGAPWVSTAAMLTQANTDLGVADTFLAADPNPSAVTQVCPTQLGSLTLTAGVYKTAANVLLSTGTLTLDGQGNANSVFIFSIGGTLATAAPGGNIVLVNGALAKNVFWRTAGITTIGAGTSFNGQVFAATQVNVNAGANITGSLYAITDRVTLIATTLTKAP